MSQNTRIIFEPTTFTRSDFTALRAWVSKIPLERVAVLYYSDDAPQVTSGLERYLSAMRAELIERAILANPLLAQGLANARKGGPLTGKILDTLIQAANAKPATPSPADPLVRWLRPGCARALTQSGLRTVADLVSLIERHGPTWWRPIPRVGQGRALVLQAWLNAQEATAIDPSTQAQPNPNEHQSAPQNTSPLAHAPLPLERIAELPSPLSGTLGLNRANSFCFIRARNDLEAVQAYLARFRDQPHTLRAYTKELERLLLWCVLIRKTPLSSMVAEDCEAYKDFLAAPSPALCGPRQSRHTPRWRPFTGALSSPSQKQAFLILQSAFTWLVNVRYLQGNPWLVIKPPRTETPTHAIQIGRALPSDLWAKLMAQIDLICAAPDQVQMRIARAAILLMGESGLRRAEVANARADKLEPTKRADQWVLQVLGKGSKWRDVPISARTYQAIQAHWGDLTHAQLPCPAPQPTSDTASAPQIFSPLPILRPIKHLQTTTAQRKAARAWAGYSTGAIANLVVASLHRVASLAPEDYFEPHELDKIKSTSAHAFRHTFGTLTIAQGMDLDVLKGILGHVSLDTTSIYVDTERERMLEQSAAIFVTKAEA